MKSLKVLIVLVVAALALTSCASGVGSEVDNQINKALDAITSLQEENEALASRILILVDTNAVEEVANNLFIQTDNMDWDALLSDVFTESVYFDMTSVGGTAGDVTAQSIVEGWEQGFQAIESVHHQSGNTQVVVDGETATVFTYGTATQYATTDSGKNTRTFIGTYNIGLTKLNGVWKVNSFAFNLKMMDGNISFE